MEAEITEDDKKDNNFNLIIAQNDDDLGVIPNGNEADNDLIVAFCLDGTVYALDGKTGSVLWKTEGSFTEGPLLQKRKIRNFSDREAVEYLVEPLGDGAMFQVHEKEEIKRLPFTLKSLVHLSPLHWQEESGKGLYFIAKREASIFALNLMTGQVDRRQFENSEPVDEANNEIVEIAQLDRATLLVGRTDYHVQGLEEASLQPQWEIILTQFNSLHQSDSSSSSDDSSFFTTFNGHLISKHEDDKWVAKLGSPILQIFKPVATENGFISLQEIESKGSVKAENHVLFDRNKATFYFDDLVNVGLMLNGGRNETVRFVLPHSHFPHLDRDGKYNKIREDDVIVSAAGHKFLTSQRVARQSIPAQVKLLEYQRYETNKIRMIYGTTLISVLTLIMLIYLKFFKSRRGQPAKSALQVSEDVLGYGSHGTIVFRGLFDGRPVAVKRLLAEFYSLAEHEIGLLQAHDTHPNVIRYFFREQQERFILIALELAHCTLYEYINPEDDSTVTRGASIGEKVDKIDLLRQIMSGLSFLHGKGVVHRDLKPQNILLQVNERNESMIRVLISDFGLSRNVIECESSSFHATARAAGTLGWRAPEIIFNEESQLFRENLASERGTNFTAKGPMKIGKSVDIFAAGLIFYFVLSEGGHAFGSRLIRESNISQGRLQINNLGVEADDLIRWMLKKNGKDRPSAEQVLQHPFFWKSEKRLDFICAVSDVLEGEEQVAKKEQAELSINAPPGFQMTVELVMRDAIDLIGPAGLSTKEPKPLTWHKELDRQVFQDLTRHRYYMVNKVHDLLRAIRNKRNHFHETPDEIKEIIGSTPIEAWEYFEGLYPKLLMESYQVIRRLNPKTLDRYLNYK